MKIIIHTMKDCPQCEECKALLTRFNIKAEWILDDPVKDREYPWIEVTSEYRYDDILTLIDEGII